MERYQNNESFIISEDSFENLKKSKSWVLFIAIVSIAIVGIFILSALFTLIAESFALGFLSLILNATLLIPLVYLFKYGNHLGELVRTEEGYHFDEAMKNLRIYWQLAGIYLIVFLGIMIFMVFLILSFAQDLPQELLEMPIG